MTNNKFPNLLSGGERSESVIWVYSRVHLNYKQNIFARQIIARRINALHVTPTSHYFVSARLNRVEFFLLLRLVFIDR